MVWKDHVCSYAPCHFPNIDGKVDFKTCSGACKFTMYVMWVYKWCHYHVGMGLMLHGLAHGVFNTTFIDDFFPREVTILCF
jgi:hypothetical protein